MNENILIVVFTLIFISGILYLFKDRITKYIKSEPLIIPPVIFYDKVEQGYLRLADILYHDSKKNDLKQDISSILAQRADGRYVGGYTKMSDEFDFLSFSTDFFYDFLRYSEERGSNIIFDLNKGANINKLNFFIRKVLPHSVKDTSFLSDSFHNTLFPYQDILSLYQEKLNQRSIQYQDILSLYQEKLNQRSIQLGSFTDGSDSSYLVLFPLKSESILSKAINDIGFEYKRISIDKEKIVKRKMALI
ncbi:MAG: Unknown protein [uncultured Sulfurovum sp.]|uniref:Uncharacterized protein n=1 Tax=uncultured Sulfurovum sp. TaxID=269237 RepID=A0A6S6T8J6_9BACT|nr:MAG: Unknown protein [uncultured Sulfurovum sp.]